ncbi:MAG: immune inhibitor A [Candidatus Promineofilum sp.]|nr:immune inhibitor A [Promineifilum sp.]
MRLLTIFVILIVSMSGCRGLGDDQSATVTPSTQSGVVVTATIADTVPTAGPVGSSPTATTPPDPPATTVPLPLSPTVDSSTAPAPSIADARQATARELAEIVPPFRDDVRLAVAYLQADPAIATPQLPADLEVGDHDAFFIGNVDSNTFSTIDAELLSIGKHAYFWFDRGETSIEPDAEELAAVTAAFDEIFQTLYAYFGISEPPGGRVHIVHAAPTALCDAADRCRLAGYFSSRDLLPESIRPQSNERTMFVMNTQQFDGATYLDVLAHELRHMLGNSYDFGEEDWFVEGGAMLAEDLVGFTQIPQLRGSLFLQNPDQQLNSWTEEDTIPYYGQGYLVNRYLYDRLGAALYHEFIVSQEAGLRAVDAVAANNQLEFTGIDLWLDWLAAMALRDARDVPDAFRWQGPELGQLATEPVNNLPASFSTTVEQFAADYYELPSSGDVTIKFNGTPTVSLMGTTAPSGDSIWYAQRANESNPRLTRAVDLRGINAATLEYKVFTDTEQGYDFAYVSASTDGGQVWQSLTAEGMQGLDGADDPSDSALAPRFYTGHKRAWVTESIDLSPFAGQEILLRFEYVTDPILTYGGFALDDIAIPEIAFRDDAETADEGWLAEGFTRATAELPQTWWLQLITFDADGRPTVSRLSVPEDGRLDYSYEATPGVRRPILIVAATAPDTLQTAEYGLEVAQ